MADPPRLEVRDLTVRYGDRVAVDGVSFSVPAGNVLGLIGPNGAGKTTVVEAVSGFLPSAGSVLVDGKAVDTLPPHRRSDRGVGRTFQALALFEDLSVEENLRVAARNPALLHDVAAQAGLESAMAHLPGQLSHARRCALGLARAMAAKPRVILLDEPAAGLDPEQRRALGGRLRELAAGGTAVVLVEHDIGLVFDVCDEVALLDRGALVALGPPAALAGDERVRAAYLGDPGRAAVPPAAAGPPAGDHGTALTVEGLEAGYARVPVVKGVDLHVGQGQVVAVLGLNGVGKTTALRAISGSLPSTARRLSVAAHDVRGRPPHHRVRAGLAHVPQTGFVFSNLSVEENLRLGPAGRAGVAVALSHFPVLDEMRRRPVHTLSGGEQRMVALAGALAWRPAVLLVDELSAGLATRTVGTLLSEIRTLASEHGTGVVVVEQHPALAMSVADRFYVMERGAITTEGGPGDEPPARLWSPSAGGGPPSTAGPAEPG